jgi:peptidoglycan/LPS O-acetylase OafA/YrhL
LPAAARPRSSTSSSRSRDETIVGASPQINALTGIRALAALWVVGFHFAKFPLGALGLDAAFPALSYGYLGVDLFFLLSGFIIYHVHQRDAGSLSIRGVLHFYGLRLARMYPVHLLTLCGLAFAVLASRRVGITPTHPEDFYAIDFVYNLFLVHSWGVADDIHWNSPAWSISCEWFVYLLFPLLALWLNRLASTRRVALWLGAEVAVFAVAYVFFFHCDLDNKFDGHFARYALARVCLEFTLGALCCRLSNLIDMRAWPWTAAVLAAILVAILLAATPLRDLAIVVVFVLMILASSLPGNLVARVLALPALVYLGEISYSLYMIHAPMRMTLGKLMEPRLLQVSRATGSLMAIGFLLTTIAVAAATYHLVETPARRWLRRLLDRTIEAGEAGARRSRRHVPQYDARSAG